MVDVSDILDQERSHYSGLSIGNGPSFGSTPQGDSGDDVFDFAIPDGMQFTAASLTALEAVDGGEARIQSAPDAGQTGTGRVRVRWSYDAFGKIRYSVKATADQIPMDTPPPPGTLTLDSGEIGHQAGFRPGNRGNDDVMITIPDRFSFQSVRLNILESRFSGASIMTQPAPGSTGTLIFGVHWWTETFGTIRYDVEVTAIEHVDFAVTVSNVSFNPDPAKAGGNLVLSADVTNTGLREIDQVTLAIRITATHLRAISDETLAQLGSLATADLPTQTFDLTLPPGMTRTLTENVTVPATIPGTTMSSAGTYDVLAVLATDSGKQIFSRMFKDLRVIP